MKTFFFPQRKHRGLLEGLATLGLSAAVMVAVRLQLMGSKAPEFAPADNPSADCPSRLTRTLTFLHLPAFNLWLLIQPSVLSFDWSMEAIPLIQSLADVRNLSTLALYSTLAYAGWNILVRRRGASDSSSSVDDAASCIDEPVEDTSMLISSALFAAAAAAATADQLAGKPGSNGYHQCCSSLPASLPTGYNNGNRTGSDSCGSSSSSLRSERTRWSSSSSRSSVDGRSSSSSSVILSSSSSTRRTSMDLTVIALSMMVLPFIPATNLFFYVGFVVAERILYIPSMGYCLLVALGVHLVDDRLLRKQLHFPRKVLRFTLVLLLIFYSARTIRRNQDWLTEESLYRSGISINPPKGTRPRRHFNIQISHGEILNTFNPLISLRQFGQHSELHGSQG